MNRGQHVLGEVRLDRPPAFARDAKLPAEERLGGGSAEADEHTRLHDLELRLQPRPAGGDLGHVRLLVDAALAACDPLEVLDDVGDVDGLPVDAGVLERLVEELPGGPDERLTGLVLLVAGLLPDEHGLCVLTSLAENGLRSALV